MKKLVLIIGIVLCIAVMGSVFAIAVYNATPATGTITGDTYVYLSLQNSSGEANINLEKGIAKIIPIVIGIDQNDANWGSAKLTVTPSAQEGKSISKVTVTLWNDEHCTDAITGLTVTGITEAKTIYVRLVLAADATQQEVTNTAGSLKVQLVRVAPQA